MPSARRGPRWRDPGPHRVSPALDLAPSERSEAVNNDAGCAGSLAALGVLTSHPRVPRDRPASMDYKLLAARDPKECRGGQRDGDASRDGQPRAQIVLRGLGEEL